MSEEVAAEEGATGPVTAEAAAGSPPRPPSPTCAEVAATGRALWPALARGHLPVLAPLARWLPSWRWRARWRLWWPAPGGWVDQGDERKAAEARGAPSQAPGQEGQPRHHRQPCRQWHAGRVALPGPRSQRVSTCLGRRVEADDPRWHHPNYEDGATPKMAPDRLSRPNLPPPTTYPPKIVSIDSPSCCAVPVGWDIMAVQHTPGPTSSRRRLVRCCQPLRPMQRWLP